MVTIDTIADYFKYLCTQHPALQHSDAAGQQVFEVLPLEESFSALRSAIKPKDYLVRLLLPTFAYTNDGNNALKKYEVGLMVVKYHGARTDTDILAVLAAAETVADNLIARYLHDSRNGYAAFQYLNNTPRDIDAQGEVLHKVIDGAYSGVQIIFSLTVTRKTALSCQTIVWPDNGTTPYPLP